VDFDDVDVELVEAVVVDRVVGEEVVVCEAVLVGVLPPEGVPLRGSVFGEAALLSKLSEAKKTTAATMIRNTPSQSPHRLRRGRLARGASGDGAIPAPSGDKVVAPLPTGGPAATFT
jgi:hypothetical protein